jgi:hypothetical protein
MPAIDSDRGSPLAGNMHSLSPSAQRTLQNVMSSLEKLATMGNARQHYCCEDFIWEIVAKRICSVIFSDSTLHGC